MSIIAPTMNQGLLPVRVDPLKSVEQQAEYSGSLAISKLERLQDFLQDANGDVQVALQFGQDEQGISLLRGQCQAPVKMTCQRCMQPVEVELQTEFELGIVFSDEQAKHLPKCYEPVIADHDSLELLDVIEDELILSLPMYAYHEDCGEHARVIQGQEAEPEKIEAPKNNPFSVLEQLKKQ